MLSAVFHSLERFGPKVLNAYPPFIGAGIRVVGVKTDDTYRSITVSLKHRWWNMNLFGSAFGGSMYAMTDPFYAMLVKTGLGPGYTVWDKSATVRYLKPGVGTLHTTFTLSTTQLKEIQDQVEAAGKAEPEFTSVVVDEKGVKVCEVVKTVHVKRLPEGGHGRHHHSQVPM